MAQLDLFGTPPKAGPDLAESSGNPLVAAAVAVPGMAGLDVNLPDPDDLTLEIVGPLVAVCPACKRALGRGAVHSDELYGDGRHALVAVCPGCGGTVCIEYWPRVD